MLFLSLFYVCVKWNINLHELLACGSEDLLFEKTLIHTMCMETLDLGGQILCVSEEIL